MKLYEVSDIISADFIKNKGQGVKIAILDTGFTPHPAVKNVVGGINFTSDNYGNADDYTDGHSHGTHITGIISYLVPKSEIYICKILNNKMIGLSLRICDAIEYCIKNNVRIINMSLISLTDSKITRDFIRKAVNNNILIIAAAGSPDHLSYPAYYKEVISVGAWSPSRRSNGNVSTVDITAPGTSILSCDINGGYTSKSGTSQAAPVVTAAAAKILCDNPRMSNFELYLKLMECRRHNTLSGKRINQGGLIDLSMYNVTSFPSMKQYTI